MATPGIEPGDNSMRQPQPIVILIAGGALGLIVANGLSRRLGPIIVIEEQPETTRQIIRRRVRLCGMVSTLGQIAQGVLHRLKARGKKDRLAEIWQQHDLDPRPNASLQHFRVPSVNSDECRELLCRLKPSVVAVYGTRIIGAKTLACVAAPFINYHAGINPKYRGQHPAYWALASGDAENCGVTIHLVDHGVDTGGVLYQTRVSFAPEDTIATYQHVQAASALPLFAQAIEDARAGRLQPRRVELPSRLWFPPTIWTYMANGMRRGVWVLALMI